MSLPDKLRLSIAEAERWLTENSADILIALGAAVALVALMLGLRGLGRRIAEARKGDLSWRAIVGRILARTSLTFIVIAAVELVVEYAAAPPAIERIVHILFVIGAALQGAVWLRELIVETIEARAGVHGEASTLANASNIIRLLVSVALFTIAIILILSNLGINATGLVAGLGIGGIAIGLAAQGIFSDLFAALSIIFDRPFRRGETIRFGDTTGTVENIGLKTTRLRSVDGDQVIIANAKLLELQIRNQADVHNRRVLLHLHLSPGSDPDVLAALPDNLAEVVRAEPEARFDHAWLLDFTPAAIRLELIFHVASEDPELMNAVRHRVMVAALRRLRELGVEPVSVPVLAPAATPARPA